MLLWWTTKQQLKITGQLSFRNVTRKQTGPTVLTLHTALTTILWKFRTASIELEKDSLWLENKRPHVLYSSQSTCKPQTMQGGRARSFHKTTTTMTVEWWRGWSRWGRKGGYHVPAQGSLMLTVNKTQKRTKDSLEKMLETRPHRQKHVGFWSLGKHSS